MKTTDQAFVRGFHQGHPARAVVALPVGAGRSAGALAEPGRHPRPARAGLRSRRSRAENSDRRFRRQADRHRGQPPYPDRGGIRSGKSVTLIANLLNYRGSVLAIDPKAELANITAERRAALGQKVIVLDPFNHAADRLARYRKRYNPLAVLTLDNPTIIEDAGLIADGLVITAPGSKDPHWDESAKNFIEGLEPACGDRPGLRRPTAT